MANETNLTLCVADLTYLRRPAAADFEEFSRKSKMSVKEHAGLVSPPLTRESFSEFVAKNENKTEICGLLVEKKSDQIAGVINVSQIFLKGFCSAYLGYYLFDGYCGRGLMNDGLRGMLNYVFTVAGLHRIEANIQPHNANSISLVRRLGFSKEGFSRKYLRIDGDWRDHERWALIKEDWESNKLKWENP